MKKSGTKSIKDLRYLCLVGVIALGLMTIVGTGGGDGGGGDETITSSLAQIVGTLEVPPGIDNSEIQGADVYVIGQESQGVQTDNEGNFTLAVDMTSSVAEENEYELIALSQTQNYGAKVDDIAVTEGEVTTVEPVTITKTGSIIGNVTLQGQSDHTGIMVYIPGTSFIAMTDSSGNYTMSQVPEGTYDFLRAEKDGYNYGVLSNTTVESDTTATVLSMELLLSTGPEGQIVINGGALYSDSFTVDLTIAASEDAVLMMLSEDVDFIGAQWEAVESTKTYTFSDTVDGSKILYIRFADANGLETTPVTATITVDTTGPTGTLLIAGDLDYVNDTQVTLTINGEDLTVISLMMISNDEGFTDVEWENYGTTKEWTLTSDDGEKTVYLKLKDIVENESDTIQATITLDTTLPFSPSVSIDEGTYTNSQSITLTLSASSDLAPIEKVMISESSDFTGAEWVDYSASINYTLSTGDGAKTIYAKFKDAAGNISSVVSDSITLDTTNPTAPEISNTGRRVTAATETISITTDSVDTNFDTYQAKGAQYDDWTDVDTPLIFNLSGDDTWYTLEIRAKDQAGNLSTSVSLLLFRGEKTILNTDPNVVHADNDWFYEDYTLSINYSPYLVTHKIVFNENATINAGVTIYFDSAVNINFYGDLDINGSSGNVVTFTSNASTPDEGDYNEIFFVGNGNLTIDYAVFEYASTFRANGELDESQIININDSIFRYLDIGTNSFTTADVNFSYCEFQCRPTTTNQGSAFSNATSTGWPVNTINIDHCYFHHCGTAINIAQKKIYNIANSNFTNNDGNIWISSSNDENNNIANNYWGYGNPGGSLSDLKIDDDGTGSLTWSPYSTSEILGTGPR